jgi:hypothetical protein
MTRLPQSNEIHGVKVPGKYIQGAYRRLYGCSLSKSWVEIFQVEAILDDLNYERIVELGTGSGALTVFMATHALMRGNKPVHSFDNKRPSEKCVVALDKLGASFMQCDIFSEQEFIGKIIDNDGLTIVYCDNGKKIDEMVAFSKYMKKGDVMLVHDYPDEVSDMDFEFVKREYGMEDWEYGWFLSFHSVNGGSMHRALVKV